MHASAIYNITGASLSEPHINGSSMFAVYILLSYIMVRWSHEIYAQYGSMDISAK